MAGEVTFGATEADNIGAQQDWWRSIVFRRKAAIRYGRTIVIGSILILPLVGWIVDWPSDYRPYLIGWAIGLLYIAIVLGGCIGLGYLLLPRRARRLFRQASMAGKPWTFRWDDDGMSYVATNGTGQYRWLEFHRWCVGRTATLCFVNDNQFIYLPHRVLSDEQRRDVEGALTRSGLFRA